jgi:phosphinothricin acetyltransferase
MTMRDGLVIRPVTAADAGAIAAIYNHYVRETIVTFEEAEVTAEEMSRRIGAISHSWLVGEAEGRLVGYAYANRYHARAAYRHTVETTIYLDYRLRRRGYGRVLYQALLDSLASQNVHVAIGSISMPNPASIGLHEALGFGKVGQFPRIGFKFGQWIDVAYLHRTFGAP